MSYQCCRCLLYLCQRRGVCLPSCAGGCPCLSSAGRRECSHQISTLSLDAPPATHTTSPVSTSEPAHIIQLLHALIVSDSQDTVLASKHGHTCSLPYLLVTKCPTCNAQSHYCSISSTTCYTLSQPLATTCCWYCCFSCCLLLQQTLYFNEVIARVLTVLSVKQLHYPFIAVTASKDVRRPSRVQVAVQVTQVDKPEGGG